MKDAANRERHEMTNEHLRVRGSVDGAVAANAMGNDKTPQILAGVGAVLILFIGIAFLFKPTHRKPKIA